jgi:hypothetical protein
MKKAVLQKGIFTTLLIVLWMSTGCSSTIDTQMDSKDTESENKDSYTVVTEENYGLAESEVIFMDYVNKISKATGTNGVGVFMHNRKGADPEDRAIMRINFDTIYSFAVVDLTEDLSLTMPETNGRYQSAWIITDEHYNPMAFVEPGIYSLTMKNVGRQYATIIMRTQVNTAVPADLDKAHEIQDQLNLKQRDKGSYTPSGHWDMEEILEMRAMYQQIAKDENLSPDVAFGKKGEVPLKEHNAGTAGGWGGLTPDRAVYPSIYAESTDPQTLTLKDVPSSAFWSVTIYDKEGYPQGEVYNINSQFAVADDDGAYIIHFGGDKNAVNYMDIFEEWNLTLRIYEPTESYFYGDWVMPELKLVK